MALSTAQIRAIAIKRRIAKATTPASVTTVLVAANDNRRSARIRGGAVIMSSAELAAKLAASGFIEHLQA